MLLVLLRYRSHPTQIQISPHSDTDLTPLRYRSHPTQIQISPHSDTDLTPLRYRSHPTQIQISPHSDTDLTPLIVEKVSHSSTMFKTALGNKGHHQK